MASDVLRQVFQAMHSNIATSINPDSVMDALFSKNVIGSDDYYRLRQVPVSRDRCREMLSLLHISKHPQAFIHLRLVLLDEYPWIVDEIDKQLASLTSQMHQLPINDSTDDSCPPSPKTVVIKRPEGVEVVLHIPGDSKTVSGIDDEKFVDAPGEPQRPRENCDSDYEIVQKRRWRNITWAG